MGLNGSPASTEAGSIFKFLQLFSHLLCHHLILAQTLSIPNSVVLIPLGLVLSSSSLG